MSNPTKVTVNAVTGESEEVEMEGEELAAYERLRAIPEPTPPPTFDELVAAAVTKALADRGVK